MCHFTMSTESRKVDSALGEEIEDTTNMDRWVGAIAVVTGASSGIGSTLCEYLLKANINVVGVARRIQLVQALSMKHSELKAKLIPLKCDLRNEKNILKIFEWIDENLGGISILINNAAVLLPTSLIDGNVEMWKTTMDVNFIGLTICTREAIKSMQKHNIDGHIVQVNSICGHFIPTTPAPCFNIYSPTKHAITALTENLRRELNFIDSKIKVSMISPGIVNTELNYHVADEADTRKSITTCPALNPEDVAEACVYILGTPPHVAVHDLMIRVVGETI